VSAPRQFLIADTAGSRPLDISPVTEMIASLRGTPGGATALDSLDEHPVP